MGVCDCVIVLFGFMILLRFVCFSLIADVYILYNYILVCFGDLLFDLLFALQLTLLIVLFYVAVLYIVGFDCLFVRFEDLLYCGVARCLRALFDYDCCV